jgi:hypothetical protein
MEKRVFVIYNCENDENIRFVSLSNDELASIEKEQDLDNYLREYSEEEYFELPKNLKNIEILKKLVCELER